ncbi:MAG: DUF5658 family protein [Acidobacteriota bacterium]
MSRQPFRFVARQFAAAALTVVASPAFAADDLAVVTAPTLASFAPFAHVAAVPIAADDAGTVVTPADDAGTVKAIRPTSRPPKRPGALSRPKALPALYASVVGLNVMDFVTTRQGLAAGAVEANPMMRGVVGNSAAFIAVKAASAATSIWMAERLWKKNRAAAIATMVVVNSGLAAVVAHNRSVLSKLQ